MTTVLQVGPYAFVLLLSGLISLVLAGFSWTRRGKSGGLYFALLMVSISWWGLAAAWEAAVVPFGAKVLAAKLQYLSIASISVLWLFFALSHGRRMAQLGRWARLLLWLFPAALAALAFTNEGHHLIWTAITASSDAPGALLIYSHGPMVWANLVYSYLLVFIGSAILIADALRYPSLYRRQAGWLIAGALFPWVGNVVYMLRLGPPGLDFTPVGFTVAGLCAGYSLFRYRLLDILPVAHEVLIDSMTDSVIVLDDENRVVGINPAARRFCGAPPGIIGRPLAELFALWPEFAAAAPGMFREAGDRIVRSPNRNGWLDVRIALLSLPTGAVSGRLVVLRDVTERKAAEQAQVTSLDRIRRQKEAVVEVSTSAAVGAADFQAAAAAITATAAKALRVERASVWLGSFEEGRIRCADLYELSKDGHSRGAVLEAGNYPGYFRALAGDRAIDADDAGTDPRISEFRDSYLRPLGIASLLDAPVRATGRLLGLVRFEHVGTRRKWLPDEIRFAGEIADQTAQALLNAERLQAQERLALREQRLRFITDNMLDMITQIDADRGAVFVSPSVEKVLGYKFQDLLGKKPEDFVHPDDYRAIWEEIERAGLKKERTLRFEYRFKRFDGSLVWLESQALLYYDANGRFSGVVLSSRDMSARRQVEEALRASIREKEVLLKELHHRVRNNMQIVSSLLNHQARAVTDPAVLEIFRESQSRIRSISLAFEQLYRSEDLSRVALGEYIEGLAVHLFHTLKVDPGRIAFRPFLDPVELDVSASIPVGLIVNELVTNSIRHAFPGERRGTISVRLESLADGRLRLAVQDDGVGLPPGLDVRRAETLGLQIVEMLVEQISGDLVQKTDGGTLIEVIFGKSAA